MGITKQLSSNAAYLRIAKNVAGVYAGRYRHCSFRVEIPISASCKVNASAATSITNDSANISATTNITVILAGSYLASTIQYAEVSRNASSIETG